MVSIKNLLTGEGNWTCVKEVRGWNMDTEAGTVTRPEKKSRNYLPYWKYQQPSAR